MLFCKPRNAGGEDEEYVLKAIEAGYEVIGFSDHCAWPYEDFVSPIRMKEEKIEEYAESIKKLREKYKDRIEILIGLETEYYPTCGRSRLPSGATIR